MPAQAKTRERGPWDVTSLPVLPGYITVEEAAERLGVSREAVHRRIKRRTLKAWRAGERPMIFVRLKDVDALPMTPQRRREIEQRAAGDDAGLDDELPGE